MKFKTKPSDRGRARLATSTAVLLALSLSACAPAVGVRSLNPQTANRELTANVLNSGAPSERAMEFLHRANLVASYERKPEWTIATLHAGLGQRDERERLFALAELSYHHAIRSNDARYHLAAALYAWMFLFDDGPGAPDCYDPRVRIAMDLYNRGLSEGLATGKSREIDLSARTVALPFGTLELAIDEEELVYGGYRLQHFTSLVDFETRGFRNRYRRRGIGAPLAASVAKTGDARVDKWIGPRAKVPMTALLRFADARRSLSDGRMRASIEVYDVEEEYTTPIDGQDIPIEADASAALAYRLQGSPLWDFEIAGFRRGDLSLSGETRGNLYMLHPYHPGRIPVVFVHGTASSPARWAEMTNEIMNDPVLGQRYQFYYFLYNTGNPIAYSASRLRAALKEVVADIDPQGRDEALRRMVVIGHSQGGLLTKMMAVRSGTRFWDHVSETPFEQAGFSSDTKHLLQESLFFEPLPFVRRLVFIATPHRGSVLAGNVVSNLARRIIHFPGRVAGATTEILRVVATGSGTSVSNRITRMPTSIDNMTPTNPFLTTLVDLPIEPGVHAHSIIAVKGKGPVEVGNDGVVAYTSAHLEPTDSTYVVRSSHSTQAVPETIEEVRRILYLHLEQ